MDGDAEDAQSGVAPADDVVAIEKKGAVARSPYDDLRRRHEARLDELPEGTYVNDAGAKCRDGFRDDTIVINTHVAGSPGEVLRYCVPVDAGAR